MMIGRLLIAPLLISVIALKGQDISFERTVSSVQVERGAKVQVIVKFTNTLFREKVKFMELLPANAEVFNIETTGQVSIYQEKRLVVTWGSTPANSTTIVRYQLRATPEIETNTRLTGAIFVDGEVVFQDQGTTLNPSSKIRVSSGSE